MAGEAPDSTEVPTTVIITTTTTTTVAPITAIGAGQPLGITDRVAPMAIGADQLPGAGVQGVQQATVGALPLGEAAQDPGRDQEGDQDPSGVECRKVFSAAVERAFLLPREP